MVYEHEIKDGVMKVDCLGGIYGSNVEDYEGCMSIVMDKLMRNKEIKGLVLATTREYEYDFDQTQILVNFATALDDILRAKRLLTNKPLLDAGCADYVKDDFNHVQEIVMKMKGDPVGAYVTLIRKSRHVKIKSKSAEAQISKCYQVFLESVVDPIIDVLNRTRLIEIVTPSIPGFKTGDRAIYREVFHPTIRPNFMLTKYQLQVPTGARVIDKYQLQGGIDVKVFRREGSVRDFYHLTPPEFNLSEDHYTLLDAARRYMVEHQPREVEFADPKRMREVFFNIGRDLLIDLSSQMGMALSEDDLKELTSILTRYTAGLGVLEIILADPKVQDVFINSPIGDNPIYIFHQDYEECITNLIPTQEDAESWATRFRLMSGRPLDEANPVLDTETSTPGGRARIAVTTRSLSPEGLSFTLRRHRDSPWTYPLYMQPNVRYLNPMFSGLMSFIIDGARTFLIAGTRSSGKTSLLSASMLELLRKYRVICVEDSVTGDSKILYKMDGKVRFGTIGELVDKQIEKYGSVKKLGRDLLPLNPDCIEVLSIDKKGKIRWSDIAFMMRHKVSKPIYEVETRTGRRIKVTADHSLFTLGEDALIAEVKPTQISEGDYIATPRSLPIPSEKKKINLLHKASGLKGYFKIADKSIDLRKFREDFKKFAREEGYSKSMPSAWTRNRVVPAKLFDMLPIRLHPSKLVYKGGGGSRGISVEIDLDEKMMEFLGLWMADGCYDASSVLITVSDPSTRNLTADVFSRFGLETKNHSDGFTLLANSSVLKEVMQVYGFVGDCYTKRIPEWVFSASEAQRHAFLRGFFSGDGYSTHCEVGMDLINRDLLEDVQTMLLIDGLRGRIRKSGKMNSMRISDLEGLKSFQEKIGFLQDYKNENLDLDGKISTHDTTDVIPIPKSLLSALKGTEKHDYVVRGNQIGRRKFVQMAQLQMLPNIGHLTDSDVFWDEVKSVWQTSDGDFVYDISVPGDENFIVNNILAHNTLELPISKFKELGYNIESLKSRSVITQVETEMASDDAIRTALRLGDSVLILGEVRSLEAKALYEAMRIGALANTVAGTIHGDSAYGVYDRVVNDLGIPNTSFKATDLIIVCNMMKSADGLRRFRRVTNITEVRKHWKDDPISEGGFVPLMEYSAKEDTLKPTDTFLNGESYILNEIASKVREWSGDWEAVWENINLRAKVKQTITEYALKTNKLYLMEAPFVVRANDMFHIVSEKLRNEVGAIPPDRAYEMWLEWFKGELK